MRVIIVTIIITVFVVTFSICSVFVLEKTSQEMLKVLDKIDLAVNTKDWKKAIEEANALRKKWEDNQMLWTIFLEHSVIDNIQISIAHIKAFLISEDLSQVRAEIAGLYIYLEDIPKNEKLSIQNIL